MATEDRIEADVDARAEQSPRVDWTDRVRVFAQSADRYDAWYEENQAAYEAELSAVAELLDDGGRGLEVGVGTGRFAARLGIDCGLEPVRSMALQSRARGVHVVRGVGERLPFAAGSFELVLMVATISFLHRPRQAMAEARRVLVEEGRIVVGLLDRASPLSAGAISEGSSMARAARPLTAVEVHEMMAETGFELEAVRQTLFDPIEEIEVEASIREGAGEGLFAVLLARPPKD